MRQAPRQMVIRFRRARRFPLFAMAEGEAWAFHVETDGLRHRAAVILSGDGEFEFAGGVCRVNDVELLYDGHDSALAHEARRTGGTTR